MNQLQPNGKTSTKRINPSDSSYEPTKKKKVDTTCSTPQLILPKPVLAGQQQNVFPRQQNILSQPQPQPQQQQQQQNVFPHQQQQGNVLSPPQQQQKKVFSQSQHQQQNVLPQQQFPQKQYVPQQYGLPSTLPELVEGYNESALLFREGEILHDKNSQPETTSVSDQDLGGWENDEIKVLLDHFHETFSTWFKGNKTKYYNDVVKNVLPNKEALAIKNKLARLMKRYEKIKYYNNQSGIKQKDWYWYDKLDLIFRTYENCVIDEDTEVKKVSRKKQKKENSVEVIAVMATTIAEINKTCEKIWTMLEMEKMNKAYEIEKEKLNAEKKRLEYEREKEKERMKMEYELKVKELELKYQKKD